MKPYYEADGITIYHGDSFDLLHDLSGIDALITDPPYSSGGAFRGDRTASVVSKYVQSTAQTATYRPDFAGDNRDQRSFLAWSTLWLNAARHAMTPGAAAALFTDWRQLPTTTDALQAAGFIWRGIAPWAKTNPRTSAGITNACEYIAWGTLGPYERDPAIYLPGYIVQATLTGERKDHIAQKPIEVMRWLAQMCPPGGTILDPFMGSGVTLRAAKDVGCRAIGVDVDERYCEIAANRLAQGVLDLGTSA